MLLLISPAKTLDFSATKLEQNTEPRLLKETKQLASLLRKKTEEDLKQLMGISDKLAVLNVERFKAFKIPFSLENAKQAVLAFKGDVYTGLNADDLSNEDLEFAQEHLRILSGFYGVLRPLDLMQAYRLEMGIKLENKRGKNLYEFWGERITKQINEDLKATSSSVVINLASHEYYKSVKPKKIKGDIYDIQFKEERNGKLKVISFSAKKARGMMSRFIIQNRLTNPKDLKGFNLDNYLFNDEISNEKTYIFTR